VKAQPFPSCTVMILPSRDPGSSLEIGMTLIVIRNG